MSVRASATLHLRPRQEFLEQPVALLSRQCDRLGDALRQELAELIALGPRDLVALLQPLVRALEALPARHHGREVRLAPLRVTRRLLEFGEPREEHVDEFLDAAIAV